MRKVLHFTVLSSVAPCPVSPLSPASSSGSQCLRGLLPVCMCRGWREGVGVGVGLVHAVLSSVHFHSSSAKFCSPFWASHFSPYFHPNWFFLFQIQRLHPSACLFPQTLWVLVISFMYVAYSPMRLEGSWRQGPRYAKSGHSAARAQAWDKSLEPFRGEGLWQEALSSTAKWNHRFTAVNQYE